MIIKKATEKDVNKVAELARMLWGHHSLEELIDEMSKYICNKDATVYLAYDGDKHIGFAQCSLRFDYVEGTDGSPVGYLEGIFIKEDYRKKGIGKLLLSSCEKWAIEKGCTEFASDCELDNKDSLKFHLNIGFNEANRIICFVKKL